MEWNFKIDQDNCQETNDFHLQIYLDHYNMDVFTRYNLLKPMSLKINS
jgi:hypothetical protein